MTLTEQDFIDFAVQNISRRQLEILRKILQGEELVRERGTAYIGYERTSPATVDMMLRMIVIKLEEGSKGGFERYNINGTGKQVLEIFDGKSQVHRN